MRQPYPIHHETILARLAPEDDEQEGRFDILQTGDRTFQVLDGGATPADEESTLAKAERSARRMAAAYDREVRAKRRQAAKPKAAAKRLFVASVTVSVAAASEVEAAAKVARALDANGTIANWHFRTFAKDGSGATFVTLPRPAPDGLGLNGNLDQLAPWQGLLTPEISGAFARLADKVRAKAGGDAEIGDMLAALERQLADATNHEAKP